MSPISVYLNYSVTPPSEFIYYLMTILITTNNLYKNLKSKKTQKIEKKKCILNQKKNSKYNTFFTALILRDRWINLIIVRRNINNNRSGG